MDRRLFLTFLVATLFTLVYLKIMTPPQRPIDPTTSAAANASQPATTTDVTTPASPVDAGADAPGKFPATKVGTIPVKRFESDQLIVDLTNRGAAISQVRLKEYWKTVDAKTARSTDENDLVALFPAKEGERRPLELREVVSANSRARWRLSDVDWDVKDERDATGKGTVTFRYASADGFEFEKRFTFEPGRHWIGVDVAVRALDASTALENLEYELVAAGGFEDVTRGQYTSGPEASYLASVGAEQRVTREYHAALKSPREADGAATSEEVSVGWVGAGNLYFCVALIPDPPTGNDPSVRSSDRVWIARSDDSAETGVQSWFQSRMKLAPVGGAFVHRSFRYYAGPKDPAVFEREGLEVMKPLLEEDFGSWTSLRWINKLLLGGLRLFHGFTLNWGVAIILLTILVRITVFPITRMQQVSMTRYSQKMAILKPKLDEMRERHKNNPQKFAQEQMKLLREHKATPPLFGCLSSFITIPVFVGIFQILRTSVDLRQAPFVAWIRDLSLPDALTTIPGVGIHLNVLPILATAAFLAQMMMQPKPTDPQQRQQQKIMLVMPIVFGVMFYRYAAGLSLYMLVSSAWAIFESKVIRKYFFPLPTGPQPAVIPTTGRSGPRK